MNQLNYSDLAKMIDHSLLSPNLTGEQLEAGCQLALTYDVASVCIMPYYLSHCTEILQGSTVQPSTTIGFPHGGHTVKIKLAEAEQAIQDGCQELDMVVNISQVLSGNWEYVSDEISAIVNLAHQADRKVKVIFENCFLQNQHKIQLCRICCEAGADWVKTSTGYGTGGATFDDLQLMLDHVAAPVQVKAAGGIRDVDSLVKARAMGVTRCGASRTQEILDDWRIRCGLEPIHFKAAVQNSGY